MLIVTTLNHQPSDFRLLAQDMHTYEVCGYTEEAGYAEVADIPSRFEQRVLPPQYGYYLTLAQVTRGLLLEQGALEGASRASSIMFVLEAESEACRFDTQTLIDNANVFVEWSEHYTGKRGSIVREGGALYKALHDVDAGQSHFRPSETPSLWKAIGNPAEEWPAWSQPISGVDLLYRVGDKVSHNGKHWVCAQENVPGAGNSYEPGVWGWTEVI